MDGPGPSGRGGGALRQMLLGRARGEMNLNALRAQVAELDRTIVHLLELHQKADYEVLVDKFSVAQWQYSNALDQLRASLKHWVVHPKLVDEVLARGLQNGMLSPKALPEQEAEDDALVEASKREGLGYESLQAQMEHVDGIIDFLSGEGTEGGAGVLGPNSRERRAIRPPQHELGTEIQARVAVKVRRDPAVDTFLGDLANVHP